MRIWTSRLCTLGHLVRYELMPDVVLAAGGPNFTPDLDCDEYLGGGWHCESPTVSWEDCPASIRAAHMLGGPEAAHLVIVKGGFAPCPEAIPGGCIYCNRDRKNG